MAIKDIIAQGIGFAPGSTKFIPTAGFSPAPYNRQFTFDAALALRTAQTVTLAAALAKRVVSKTGNFAVRSSFDGTARGQTEGWGVSSGAGGSSAALSQVTDAAFHVDTTQVGEFASTLGASWSYLFVAVPGPYIVGKKYVLQFEAKLVSGASNWTAAIQDGNSTNVVLAPTAFVPGAGVTLFEIPFTAAVAGNTPVVFFALGSATTSTIRITGINVFDSGSAGYSYGEPVAIDYSAVVLADTPAIYHRLGEASGTTAVDSSGNGRNGTHSSGGNVPTYGVAGAPIGSTDTAMRYGVGGNTSITTTLHNDSKTLFTGSFSVEAWFNKPVIVGGNFERLVAKSWVANGWLLGYYNATIQFGLGDAGGSQHNANPNQATWDTFLPGWHHAVGTYDGSNVRLYVDGQLIATTAYSGWTPSTTLAAAIGSGQQSDDIDEVALYDGVALSLARIQAHYYAGSYYHTDGQPWSVTWDAAVTPRVLATATFDAALALRTLVTATFDAALALRTSKTAAFDAALGARLNAVATFDAALALRTLKTATWDTALGGTRSTALVWDAVIGIFATTPVPTDEEIADALAGLSGPVSIRYRYEQRDHTFTFQNDLTDAVEDASVTLDNHRAITRTARFRIRATSLPADFDPDNDHVAVFAELRVINQYVRYPLGLFHLDSIREIPTPNGNEMWESTGADVIIHLFESTTTQPYIIPAGTLYTAEVERLLLAVGLRSNIAPSTLRTPVAFTWAPDKSFGEIVNDLLTGINYFPIWADAEGVATSRRRLDPYAEPQAVSYTTADEPRMVRPEFTRQRERGRYTNRVIVTISDPARARASVQVTNDDDDSPISTVNKHAVTSSGINADRIVDTAMMAEVGAYLLRDASANAQLSTLGTHPDPRRQAHEFYSVTLENSEVESPWRAEGWTYDCRTGATMQHQLGRASRVDVTTEELTVTA